MVYHKYTHATMFLTIHGTMFCYTWTSVTHAMLSMDNFYNTQISDLTDAEIIKNTWRQQNVSKQKKNRRNCWFCQVYTVKTKPWTFFINIFVDFVRHWLLKLNHKLLHVQISWFCHTSTVKAKIRFFIRTVILILSVTNC